MAGQEPDYILDALVNHITLPPRLPFKSDTDGGPVDQALARRLATQSRAFRKGIDSQYYDEWSVICRTVDRFVSLHGASGHPGKDELIEAFQAISISHRDVLIIYVAMQNAGLIIRKADSDQVVFEAFEASAQAAEVLSSERALQWDFPSHSVAIPLETFNNPGFQRNTAEFIEKASIESVKQFAATSSKAGSRVFESRDRANPALVCQLLMAVLEACGALQSPIVTRKRVRDDVCWGDGAKDPWRRSASWLVLRVGLQRSLCALLGSSHGLFQYKFFIASFIARLCDEFLEKEPIQSDLLAHVRTKLARRLSKLQSQRHSVSADHQHVVKNLFISFEYGFRSTLEAANNRLSAEWSNIRNRSRKQIRRLAKRADDENLVLSLTFSRQTLQNICRHLSLQPTPTQTTSFGILNSCRNTYSTKATGHASEGFDVGHYVALAELESEIEAHSPAMWSILSQSTADEECSRLASRISQYKLDALPAYTSSPEQLSIMLLTIMELWVSLDSIALKIYPMLADYPIELPVDCLHVLQLARLSDLYRLLTVEKYLQARRKSSDPDLPSIFWDLSHKSFAVQYFNGCVSMQELMAQIEDQSYSAKESKMDEWEIKSSHYETLIKQAAEKTCLYFNVEDRFGTIYSAHDEKNCEKHFLERQAKRLRIAIHEQPLPEDLDAAKFAVFELLCPRGFAAWRDATWNIVSNLGRKPSMTDTPPKVLLQDYSELQSYYKRVPRTISLASRTKSFLGTHFSSVPFPVALDQIFRPNGLRFGLYDHQQRIWTSKQTTKPSFASLCACSLPARSPFSTLSSTFQAVVHGKRNLSSNDIIASQTDCPNSLTVFEFLSFQDLLLGTKLKWANLLRELASPNLNFGGPATATLVSQLALQVGGPGKNGPLRVGHWVFGDLHFCTAFLGQIKKRLDTISTNWRESQTLECMTTLTEQLWQLGTSSQTTDQAIRLLKDVRATALGWTRLLRQEILIANDAKSAQMRSKDALFAAFICRRTYALENQNSSKSMGPEALSCLIEASIVFSDNMPEKGPGWIGKLPLQLRNMFLRDVRIINKLENKMREAVLLNSPAVDRAMNNIWPEATDAPSRAFTPWKFLSSPLDVWISAQSVGTDGVQAQDVQYNTFDGTLLINGQRLGRLPEDYTKEGFFVQLLGDRLYRTYPSPIVGMTCMLAARIEGNQVHFGFRENVPFMRAQRGQHMFELIRPRVFFGPTAEETDLPLPLINNHVHWLDLGSGSLHITPKASMWRSKRSDWILDIRNGHARRRNSFLVDVRSPVFRQIASIIEPFEDRNQMIVFQPERNNLSLTLPRLEVSFTVNTQGLLQSRQLRAIVAENQDAGTFYGLESKLVLLDATNPSQRSIAVTMGETKIQRQMGHVRAKTQGTGFYCRYPINEILKRLDCPPEPRVVYMKAFCHAITAFVCPDPLTGRTGTEEALHSLSSGAAQPWAPPDAESYRLLSCIAALTPKRTYYPIDIKVQQKVSWMDSLTFFAQHDEFHPAVSFIMHQCRQLHRFNKGTLEPPAEDVSNESHLMRRAHSRNQTHRLGLKNYISKQSSNTCYLARDYGPSTSRANALEAASLIRDWSGKIAVSKDLAAILQTWPVIQGYEVREAFQPHLLDELTRLDVASHWGSLFRYCQELSESKDLYRAMFFFAVTCFRKGIEMVVMRTLIAFVTVEEFQLLSGPKWDCFTQFRKGQRPTLEVLILAMTPSMEPYPPDERSLVGNITLNTKQRRKLELAQIKYEEKTRANCQAFAETLLAQWPCESPSAVANDQYQHIDVERALSCIQSDWLHLFKNYEFGKHLQDVQQILDFCDSDRGLAILDIEISGREAHLRLSGNDIVPLLEDLMTTAEQNLRRTDGPEMRYEIPKFEFDPVTVRVMDPNPATAPRAELQELEDIIRPFFGNENPVRHAYGEHLRKSLVALQSLETSKAHESIQLDRSRLLETLSTCRNAVRVQFDAICMALNRHPSFTWLSQGGIWPSLTPVTLLESIGSSSHSKSKGGLKNAIIAYGELITILQRLLRIQEALKPGANAQLDAELRSKGSREWRPKDHPDWLLLEIEGNILIRPDQYRVAKAMISPESGSNSVLQMNMGQGKSSVIIPMIAALLADRSQIIRVIVPKPLLLQVAQLFQSRLGGLLGRVTKHVPFSRKSSTTKDNIGAYWDLHRETLELQGIILALPEHLLSFKLSGLQRLSSGRLEEAAFMLKVQAWLTSKFRDVLDECDHTLAVKTQLVYPSGAQHMIDGHPGRWKVVQAVLRLVRSCVRQLQREHPRSIQVVERDAGGSFPTMHFSQDSIKDDLVKEITKGVCMGEGDILPVNDCTTHELDSVTTFLTKGIIPKERVTDMVVLFKDRQVPRQDLLLLRGLFVHRLLLMALNKRWNVQYGLHPRRDPVAVPFHAKGVPSEQAEFGHPDVAILLTCLSFYYSGLEVDQLGQVLKHALMSDDPALLYEKWVRDADSLPESLRTWGAINTDDELQQKELWAHFRYTTSVIDCFLNTFVFPNHARTFERKLVSSAWDIPLPPVFESGMLSKKPLGLTTGFSGTNDNRTLLPLNIEQRDLPGLAHTNAEVLTYLLQLRNRRYVFAADRLGRRLTETAFLHLISKYNIRMLLDAGAQILEFNNLKLVQTWLDIDTEAEAAVYFDEGDLARVLYRDGRRQPLVASPYNDNLGPCVVYLDEAHTRGTDLKMPLGSVAALTLGPGQTKDHTVQGECFSPLFHGLSKPLALVLFVFDAVANKCRSAAMRLRQLATLQSIVFFAPPEVHQSILNLINKGRGHAQVSSRDVISWLLEQSCTAIEQIQPLYISQGLDYCQRTTTALANQDAVADFQQRSRFLRVLEQPEQYSLEQLYAPRKKIKTSAVTTSAVPLLAAYVDRLNYTKKNMRDTSDTVQALAHQQVEQEREVAIEVETVREVKKPSRAIALRHPPLHRDLLSFVKQGRVMTITSAYEQVFIAMRRTAVGLHHPINGSATVSKLFVSSDFMATVQVTRGQPRDEFLRPVQWVLWSTKSEAAIVISPHEAEELLDEIRLAETPRTHLISYTAPVTRNMLAFDTLNFYSTPRLPSTWCAPSWLSRDLGIFAGRLYFNYAEYPSICAAVGQPPPDDLPPLEDLWDLLPFADETVEKAAEPFAKAPLEFLQRWLSVRRKGQDFSQTPMGYVCSGKEVKRNSVFFAA